jgi:hypothetical protein
MMIGALALCFYSIAVCELMKRCELSALAATAVSLIAWMSVALGGKWLLLG